MSDIEKMIGGDYAQLTNTNIRSFGWKGVTVTVKDRQSQQPKTILSDVNGIVKAGELLALMGPSYVLYFHTNDKLLLTNMAVVRESPPFSTCSPTGPPRSMRR
jgi:hypothetical protein